LKAAIDLYIEDKDWKNASGGYRNLADLQFRAGRLEEGLLSAKRAIEAAEKVDDKVEIKDSKAYLAQILHLLGKAKEAGEWFRQADELEMKISGYRLYSLRGVAYADFLISIKRINEAADLTRANLEICQRNWPGTDDISRCHRCLAAIWRINGRHQEAADHLQKALELSRKVGMPFLEIEALLESGRIDLEKGRLQTAINAADAVLKLCQRTGFSLYEPEAELILAKAYLAQNNPNQDKTLAQSVYGKAEGMGYQLAKNEAEHLLAKMEEAV
jgi:tetratricopeptide (TPR) repeat protein